MTADPYDLRELFRSLGRFRAPAAGDAAAERTDTEYEVEVLDERTCRVEAEPLPVRGFVDGIQAHMCVAYREQRPVHLYYVAAGALGSAGPEHLEEHLALLCAASDREWVEGLGSAVPVETQEDVSPPELSRLAITWIGAERDRLERATVTKLLGDRDDRAIVVDGSLTGRPEDPRVVGVVKTTQTRYLPDESSLWGLPEGWRSARFRIAGREKGDHRERWSCYVQLVDKERAGWNLGLVRLETRDPELLEPLAARCLLERQGSRSGDFRWDRHLNSVKAVEEFLRARRPKIFQI